MGESMHCSPVTAFIALGANLGDSALALRRAISAISQLPNTQLVQGSSFYQTAPIDSSGPDYTNAVIEIKTALPAPKLLSTLQKLEQFAGRLRPHPNAPRTLDLDILLYGSASISSPTLTVPHPRMWQRAFVLLPLHEIAPHLVKPPHLAAVSSQTIKKIT
jgi:2-amino-4-hydroxy-6-hydroxymethyldihydropteridine diphosphokinase